MPVGCFDLLLDAEKCKDALEIPSELVNADVGLYLGEQTPVASPQKTPWSPAATPGYAPWSSGTILSLGYDIVVVVLASSSLTFILLQAL